MEVAAPSIVLVLRRKNSVVVGDVCDVPIAEQAVGLRLLTVHFDEFVAQRVDGALGRILSKFGKTFDAAHPFLKFHERVFAEAVERSAKDADGNAESVVTGGSLGAEHINLAVRAILPELLKVTGVILVAGRERYPEMLDLKDYEKWEEGKLVSNFLMLEFSGEMYKLFGAADVVVSRAGASTITELSSMGKPVIMVPNQKLPGHHQVKNAEAYEKAKAAIIVRDEDITGKPEMLLKEVKKLVKNSDKQKELAKNLRSFAKDDAAERIADMEEKKSVSS